jgi:hypothetical protein
MLALFHGSNQIVKKPIITNRFKTLDFGEGFYTTTNQEQAENFALKVPERRKFVGTPTVNCYEFNANLDEFKVLKFDAPNEEWLDFVVSRRRNEVLEQKYDLIIGPVANDDVFATILLYERGIADKETTIKNFKIKPLYTQYLFCSELILEKLIFVNSYEVSKKC